MRENDVLRTMIASGLRRMLLLVIVALLMLPLTGCLYPKENSKQNVPPKEAVRNVQAAIDQYYAEVGLLPIRNSSQEVPKYEKFKIDFKKLQSGGYLGELPKAAFENGGNYYFIIIDEETAPRVKLMDIVSFQKINDIQNWVKLHISNGGALPKKDAMYPGFYTIDYKSMNRTAPVIQSVYSGGSLQAIIDDQGIVYTDYGIDIMQLIERSGGVDAVSVVDLRELLVDASDFVPVKAPEYRLIQGEPAAILPE